jgi:glycosyltransferase involved in cell wall biosynthesis
MKKILLVVPDLSYSFFGRQLSLLAPKLPRGGDWQLQVVSLNGAGPNAKPIQDAGIPVYGHPGQRLLDAEDWLTLRRRITSSNPDLVHVCGLSTLRILRLACLGKYGRLKILCSPGTEVRSKPGRWTRRLLRGCAALVAANPWERKELESLGADGASIRSLAPAVGTDPPADVEPPLPFAACGKYILCVSGFEAAASARDAVWDFDILRYIDPNLHLVMIGDGPALPQVENFGRQLAREDHRVHYLGHRADVAAWMRKAAYVWIPNRAPSGTGVALEAMNAGTPVVAADLPNLRPLQNHEPTMTFVPPGTPTSLARATRHLMLHPETARARGEAARRYVREHHDVKTVVTDLSAIYESLTG